MTASSGPGPNTTSTFTGEDVGRTAGGLTPPTVVTGRTLVEAQNDASSLELLAAKYDRYERATSVSGWAFVLMLSTVLFAVLKPLKPEWSLGLDLYVMAAFFVELLLDRAQESLQEEGARVQEVFDRRLYQLSWPHGWIEKPTAETIALWAQQGRTRASSEERARWLDWYPVEVAVLPLALARMACQRANAWWDANQRESYAKYLIALSGIMLAGLIAVAVVPDLARDTVKDNIIVWLPVPYWLMREGLRHRRAARERCCALERAMAAVDDALRVGMDEATLTRRAEEVQAALSRQRQAGPMVWPRFYRLRRPQIEQAMKTGATDVVQRYLARYPAKNM
jgi:hypothetical protein